MGSYTISKEFRFEAAHQLHGLDPLPGTTDPHQCMSLHGHSYRVELTLRREELDEHGFVVDYHAMKPFGYYIDTHMDHTFLNDLLPVTTAEQIAKHLYGVAWNMFHDVAITVRVSETAKTWAQYSES